MRISSITTKISSSVNSFTGQNNPGTTCLLKEKIVECIWYPNESPYECENQAHLSFEYLYECEAMKNLALLTEKIPALSPPE